MSSHQPETTSSGATLRDMIWQIVAAIPHGRVTTYGTIARLIGHPGHSRYVGTVLKQLPGDSRLPWHRVINSRGAISFPPDSTAFLRQQQRLLQEGVECSDGRISLQRYLWPDQ